MTKAAVVTAAMVDELPLVLTIEELATVLRISVRTIYRHLARGTFPIPTLTEFRLGTKRKQHLWRRREVLDYLEHAIDRPMVKAALERPSPRRVVR